MPAKTANLPAPVGGWNARDALSDMAATDAVSMVNWWPLPTDVQQRRGYSQFVTGIGAEVETLMVYNGLTASKMFGAAGTDIYDCSAAGAVGAAVVSTMTNARWQYVNMGTAGGQFLCAVNGADAMRIYNGTAWGYEGDGTYTAITGVSSTNCIHINVHKFRIWLIPKNSLSAWYLPTNSIGGLAVEFPLAGVAKKGGYLMAMGTWTGDAGYGSDDLAAFVTSQGEVIVYKGTDPSDATKWSLVGVWHIGSPIGRRCFEKFAGDLLLITQDGLVPMWSALQSDRLDPRVALTDKIYSAISAAVDLYGSNYGWQVVSWPKSNMLLINVPVQTDAAQQYAMNTITKSWCNFTGWGANCWAVYGDDLYFGANGVVGKAWDTFSDNGGNIYSNLQQAFTDLKAPGRVKRMTLMRPIISTDGNPPIYAGINTDYDTSLPVNTLTQPPVVIGASWDTADWDTSSWASDLQILRNWQGVAAVGEAFSPHYVLNSTGIETHLMSTTLVYEVGGVL